MVTSYGGSHFIGGDEWTAHARAVCRRGGACGSAVQENSLLGALVKLFFLTLSPHYVLFVWGTVFFTYTHFFTVIFGKPDGGYLELTGSGRSFYRLTFVLAQ